ncbi:hypothetical protein NMY22_g15730 [Coprinellus aureogranulatus]|nr:hypothetical protein NMY22_g15730 [Coprinellus aureogranulatus]
MQLPSPTILARAVPYFAKSYPVPRLSLLSTAPSQQPGDLAAFQAALPSKRYQRMVEVSVDASGWGLGMVAQSGWQAWRWKEQSPFIPRHPRTGEIYVPWAELKAVEVGLAALTECGLRRALVLVNCDNQVVFETFKRLIGAVHPTLWGSSVTSELLTEGVARIGELACQNELDLGFQWVVGSMNPADKPSRGKGLEQKTRFCGGYRLTEHLAQVVSVA